MNRSFENGIGRTDCDVVEGVTLEATHVGTYRCVADFGNYTFGDIVNVMEVDGHDYYTLAPAEVASEAEEYSGAIKKDRIESFFKKTS